MMFSSRYRKYALATMTAVYMWNLVDRALMILLLQSIKEDLQLSDTQLGFLTGIAFGLFYATLGLPLARWSDRGDRVTITSMAIALWGVTVMSCLYVTTYSQLLLSRIAAAIGESGCKPPTYSLVGDYFPEPTARTRAMAVYMTGSPLAALISFVVGGWLNELYGWRMTMFVMGVPGLVLGLLVKYTILEPRNVVSKPSRKRSSPPLRKVVAILRYHRSLRNLCAALILLYTLGMGLAPWYAAFMMRSHGMHTGELGLWFGLIFSLAGIVGILIGGIVASRWFANDERAQVRLSAISSAFIGPCLVVFLTVPNDKQALAALVPLVVVFSVFLGPTYALMQRLVADEIRATMMALVMLLANLIGFGLGPQIVGVLSDVLLPVVGSNSLRYAMIAMSFLSLWAAYHFWCVGRTVRDDLAAIACFGRVPSQWNECYGRTKEFAPTK